MQSAPTSLSTSPTPAHDSGGRAIRNENNLTRALNIVEDDTSTYYVIGYAPADAGDRTKPREINVRVTRPVTLGSATAVNLGTIEMEHYAHGGDAAIAAGCASCHVHETGELELSVTTTGCSLCHAESLDGSKPEGCRLCHTDPGHVALTSQNVPVLHSELPWIGVQAANELANGEITRWIDGGENPIPGIVRHLFRR